MQDSSPRDRRYAYDRDRRADSKERSSRYPDERDRRDRVAAVEDVPARPSSRGPPSSSRDDRSYRDGRSKHDSRYDRPGLPPHVAKGRSNNDRDKKYAGTPPPKDRVGGEERHTPGSGPRKSATPLASTNPLFAELMKQAKVLHASTRAGANDNGAAGADGSEGDAEAGEIPDHVNGAAAAGGERGGGNSKKRKHSPILWEPAGGGPAGGSSGSGSGGDGVGGDGSRAGGGAAKQPRTEPLSLLERAQQEAQLLKQAQHEYGYDPDAPAAVKASPSFSGSMDGTPRGKQEEEEVATGGGNGHRRLTDSEHEDSDRATGSPQDRAGGARSRWLSGHDDEEDNNNEERVSVIAQQRSRRRGAVAASQQPMDERSQQGFAGGGNASPPAAAGADYQAGGGGGTRAGAYNRGSPDGGGSAGSGDDDDADQDGDGGATLPPALRYDMRRECRDVHEFERIEKISEGTYGVVYKAREKKSGRIVALKRVKMENETNGFPVTSVREINILLNFHHPNIVNVEEIVVSARAPDQIYMVMEYMDHDLKSLMEDKARFSQPFSAGQLKCLMHQLLSGLAFLHANWVLHRDLKTSNILYNSRGELKLCDMGMARQYGEPLAPYTQLVITLWYRPPELLLGETLYSTAVDMWSVGCIMAEMLSGKPLLPGKNEIDQLLNMVDLLGTPTDEDWPARKSLPNWNKIDLGQKKSKLRTRFTASTGFGVGGTTLTEAGYDLLSRLLAWDPERRISAADALRHRWFDEPPRAVPKLLMPQFQPRKGQ